MSIEVSWTAERPTKCAHKTVFHWIISSLKLINMHRRCLFLCWSSSASYKNSSKFIFKYSIYCYPASATAAQHPIQQYYGFHIELVHMTHITWSELKKNWKGKDTKNSQQNSLNSAHSTHSHPCAFNTNNYSLPLSRFYLFLPFLRYWFIEFWPFWVRTIFFYLSVSFSLCLV